MTTVSLLIPCYNSEHTLPHILNDAVSQKRPFDEIIVLNDGSTDNSVAIAEKFPCKIINNTINLGIGNARQQLLEAASSEYVHFHDADDRMNPEFLASLLPYIDKNTAVCCALQEVDTKGQIEIKRYPELNQTDRDQIPFFIRNFIHLNTAIYHRGSALQAGGFERDFRTNEDRVFHYRLLSYGLRFKFLDKVLVTQIRNPQSTTSGTKFCAIIKNYIRGAEIAIKIFPKSYQNVILEYMFFYAEKALSRNERELMSDILEVAKRNGAKSLTNFGAVTRFFSRIIGIKNSLLLRHKYSKIRAAFGHYLE